MQDELREQLAQLVRKNAELTTALEQAEAREERWRTIVSTDPECVKTISPEGYLIEMNPAGLAMLSATTLDQVRSKPLLEWIAPEHQAAFADLHRRVMSGESGALEFEVIALDRKRRWLRTQACPLRDRTGAITSTLGISRDITGQRELEAQLRQSQKMEAIGQLAGGIAHDFNNILTVIQGFSLTLLEGESDPVARESATRHIVEAVERASGLTRQLLAFGRRQVMQPQHVDLNELVTSLAAMVRRVLGEEIDLQLQLWPAALPVHADRGLIDQVLMNVVINARDAMPAGGIIRVETLSQSSPQGTSAVVRVIDSGSGIPEDQLPLIFDPFFTTKPAGKGSGLGLATAFGIVAQHSGRIEVSSRLGRGTTFDIVLPASTGLPRESTPAPRLTARNGGTETILLVEDERAVRVLTRRIMERAGYTVIEAANGAEGLRAWNEAGGKVDILLTDVVMPDGMSGRELADRLLTARPGLRVVFTSGYSPDFAGRELRLKDRQSFLQKPATPQQMLDAVRRSLDASG
ncbi:MAG TPA: ATP-binding protein [Vicinamibacterales bacterium]|nr:ATP-binding protein [Vicinamibacterales bacterium]